MGIEAFIRAMAMEPDVIVTGRACDTAVFAAVPIMLGYPIASSIHMAKIIECTSLCCIPGGRDAMLGTLDDDGFTLESMNPARAATPLSVAAHSLYEQADPLTVYEPEGMLHVGDARFEAIDERRTRVCGATWHPADQHTVKIEASEWVGERAILCAGSCDPRVIANSAEIVTEVRKTVSEIIPPTQDATYDLILPHLWRERRQPFPGKTERRRRRGFLSGGVYRGHRRTGEIGHQRHQAISASSRFRRSPFHRRQHRLPLHATGAFGGRGLSISPHTT